MATKQKSVRSKLINCPKCKCQMYGMKVRHISKASKKPSSYDTGYMFCEKCDGIYIPMLTIVEPKQVEVLRDTKGNRVNA